MDTVVVFLMIGNGVRPDLAERLGLELFECAGCLGLPSLGERLGGVFAIEIGRNGDLECDLAHLLELKSAGIFRWA